MRMCSNKNSNTSKSTKKIYKVKSTTWMIYSYFQLCSIDWFWGELEIYEEEIQLDSKKEWEQGMKEQMDFLV